MSSLYYIPDVNPGFIGFFLITPGILIIENTSDKSKMITIIGGSTRIIW